MRSQPHGHAINAGSLPSHAAPLHDIRQDGQRSGMSTTSKPASFHGRTFHTPDWGKSTFRHVACPAPPCENNHFKWRISECV